MQLTTENNNQMKTYAQALTNSELKNSSLDSTAEWPSLGHWQLGQQNLKQYSYYDLCSKSCLDISLSCERRRLEYDPSSTEEEKEEECMQKGNQRYLFI
jgi:hypothetical protein